MPVELVQRGTYAEINELLRTRQIDFAFVCAGAYVRGGQEFGMEVLAVSVVEGSMTYYSYIIVPADSPAADPAGLRLLLQAEPDMEVVAEAANGRQAVDRARVSRPDVVLLDISMPAIGGLEVIQTLKRELPALNKEMNVL